jgi:hypothetical protein
MKTRILLMVMALFCLASNVFSQGGIDLTEHFKHQNDVLNTSFNLSWSIVVLVLSFSLIVFLTSIMEKSLFPAYIIIILVFMMILYLCTGNIFLFAIALFVGNRLGKSYFKSK